MGFFASVITGYLLGLTTASSSLPAYGPFSPGPGQEHTRQLLETAGRLPDATHSVSVADVVGGSWSWTVNVTEVVVPDSLLELEQTNTNRSRDIHFTNTQWQVRWPGQQATLQEFLRTQNVSVQINFLKAYIPGAVNGLCSDTVGDQCAASMQRAAQSRAPIDWDSLPGCHGTIGSVHGVGASVGLSSVSRTTYPITADSSFFYTTSAAYVAGSRSAFDEQVKAFHVLAMHFYRPQSGTDAAQAVDSIMLCQVAQEVSKRSITGVKDSHAVGLALTVVSASILFFVWK